jgi:hypothetical protein
MGVYLTEFPSKVKRMRYTRASEGESALRGSEQRDLTSNIVIDFPGPCVKVSKKDGARCPSPRAGKPKARTIRQIVDRSRDARRSHGERMRSDVSRSGIVIDMLVKWVALTFAVCARSFFGRHGEGFFGPSTRRDLCRIATTSTSAPEP